MVFEHQDEYPSQWKAIESIAEKLDINRETLRVWVRRVGVDDGRRPGLTTDERARMKELEREIKELRRANEIQRVYDDNMFVYGAAKIWGQLNKEGLRVAR